MRLGTPHSLSGFMICPSLDLFEERFTAADRKNPTSLHKKPRPINLAFKPLLSQSCNHQNLRADCPLTNTSHSMTFNILEMINAFLLHL